MRTFRIIGFITMIGWFACQPSSENQKSSLLTTQEQDSIYLLKGKTITSNTFVTLSGQLQKALLAEGVSGAVKYCNLAAFPIVDSLSQVYNAKIKRTSLKLRNPENHPSQQELAAFSKYEQIKDKNQPLKPMVNKLPDEEYVFYAPIIAQGLCLKCHGKIGETLAKEDYDIIQELYPEDQATGYIEGDLRGIWSITFLQ